MDKDIKIFIYICLELRDLSYFYSHDPHINIISDRICMQATLLERGEMKTTNMCNIITHRQCTLFKINLTIKKKNRI